MGLALALTRDRFFRAYPWLARRQQQMIVYPALEGLLTAALLQHYLGWKLLGYYDHTNLWLAGVADEADLVWVGLGRFGRRRRSIGVDPFHPAAVVPPRLRNYCNPNLPVAGAEEEWHPCPFSTLLFLLWLYDQTLPNTLRARMLVLTAGDVWQQVRESPEGRRYWQERLPGYDWEWLFRQVDSVKMERRMSDELPAMLAHLQERLPGSDASPPDLRQPVNPDWEEDALLEMADLAATHLRWSLLRLPVISHHIHGKIARTDLGRMELDRLAEAESGKRFSFAWQSASTVIFSSLKLE